MENLGVGWMGGVEDQGQVWGMANPRREGMCFLAYLLSI